jgi:hypothetical protein
MDQSQPIACTLTSSDLASRIEELRALGGDGLVSVTESAGRAELHFRAGEDIRRRVEGVAAAEAECCAFLDFRVDGDAAGTVLTITAPNGGGEAIPQLVAAFGAAERI